MSRPEPLLSAEMAAYLVAVEPRYAVSSLRIHRYGLRCFERFCAEQARAAVVEVDERCLESFHGWLCGLRFSESTMDMALRSTKLFLQWSYRCGLTLWDGGTYRLTNPRGRTPKPPTGAVMKRLLELPDPKTCEGSRDLLVLELLYVLGLRRAECCALELGSLNLNAETLFITGKGGDERLLPVGPSLGKAAWRYLRRARPVLLPAPSERALLLRDDGRRLTVEAVAYIVKKYGALLGLVLSPHQLRHACATHLIEAGMELAHVQCLLGHRRIDSTQRYAQILGREVHREFSRSHPRARAGHELEAP